MTGFRGFRIIYTYTHTLKHWRTHVFLPGNYVIIITTVPGVCSIMPLLCTLQALAYGIHTQSDDRVVRVLQAR